MPANRQPVFLDADTEAFYRSLLDMPCPLPVTFAEGAAFSISRVDDAIQIACRSKTEALRGIGLLKAHLAEFLTAPDFAVTQAPAHKHLGAMIDCSRGQVPTVQTLRTVLTDMALMGYDRVMLYTEDTYPLPEEPYFGYLRGAYTREELQETDALCRRLGIDLIPCMQTLAHLDRFLKWKEPKEKYWDAADVLLCDSEDTHALLDRMFASLRQCFTSDYIHIGMDEAQGLGLGRHLQKHGYEPPQSIMARHLKTVLALCKKYGFKPLLWSDMFFRTASKEGSYYQVTHIPEDVKKAVPAGVQLVYWDYYHEDKDFYVSRLKLHDELAPNTAFAGGTLSWHSMISDTELMLRRSLPALKALREQKTEDIWLTMWGDDGGECPLMMNLYAMQVYADVAYEGGYDEARLARRFEALTGQDARPLLWQSIFHRPLAQWKRTDVNACKFLLYQDPLMGLFDKDLESLSLNPYYEALRDEYAEFAADAAPAFAPHLAALRDLAGVLAVKADLGKQLRRAYREQNRHALNDLLRRALPALEQALAAFAQSYQAAWMQDSKPFGYELHDMRLGALMQRLLTAKRRLKAYLDGALPAIDELEAELLPHMTLTDPPHAHVFHRDIAISGVPSPLAPAIPIHG